MDLAAYRADRAPRVEAFLEALLPSSEIAPQSLHAAMRHAVLSGGKRLRPLFAMAAAEAVGAAPERALPVAAAVELIHAYSLVHDDLPCMDDDALRRGLPTVHVAYGEAVAVLAGDALQALAFETLANAARGHDAEPVAAALRELARAAGPEGLVGGQVDDLDFAKGGSNEVVESVHRRKTAALFAAAVAGGALLGGADGTAVEALRAFGMEVGIGFQIADDLEDEHEDSPCSSLAALGSEGARARSEELLAGALSRLEAWGGRAEILRELARFAVRRKS